MPCSRRHDRGKLLGVEPARLVRNARHPLGWEVLGVEHVQVDMHPPALVRAGHELGGLASHLSGLGGDRRGVPNINAETCDGGHVESSSPGVIPGAKEREAVRSDGGHQRSERTPHGLTGHTQEEADLGVCRFAVLRHIQRHGVLMAIDDQQTDPTRTLLGTGHDAEQGRAVAADDTGKGVGGDRPRDPHREILGHGDQRRFVDETGIGSPLRTRCGQQDVFVGDNFQRCPRGGDSGVPDGLGGQGLVSCTTVTVERDSDDRDLHHVLTPSRRGCPAGR